MYFSIIQWQYWECMAKIAFSMPYLMRSHTYWKYLLIFSLSFASLVLLVFVCLSPLLLCVSSYEWMQRFFSLFHCFTVNTQILHVFRFCDNSKRFENIRYALILLHSKSYKNAFSCLIDLNSHSQFVIE